MMFAVIAMLGLIWTAGFAAETAAPDELEPGPNDRQITLAVRSYLEREHLTRRQIDDEIASRWFDMFLGALDPMKMYFMQADIAEFSQRKNQLDDLVRRGNVDFAYDLYERFVSRIGQRLPQIEELIQSDLDFTVPETIVVDPDDVDWAASEEEAQGRWRRRVKYDLLVQKMEKTPVEEAQDKLLRRYRSFAKRMQKMTADELLETYLTSLTASLDPHTTYMSPGTLENFQISMRLELDGIGASLRSEDGYTTVAEIVAGGAADRDGRLQKKDRVVAVGQGTEGELVDVVDMNLNEVVKLIRGKRGTTVRLKVIPVGQTAPKILDIVRDRIELKDSEARGEVIEAGNKADGTPWRVGVINLPSFYMDMAGARSGQADYKSTTRDCRRLIQEFKQEQVDCVVLDLRDNGGGSLPESISLTGLFIDTGPVVQVKDADDRVQQYDDTEPGVEWDGPLVVLINKFSASASEILAGAIQDYRRGLVVGDEATHGKGTVQSLLDLGRQLFQRLPNAPSLGAIKITMQQFYRPSGDSTQNEGVKSDIELPSITTHLEVGESDLDYALAFDRVPRATFESTGRVSDELVNALRERSQARVATDEEFERVVKDIEKYKLRKQEKEISLVESEFVKHWNDFKAADDEEKKLEEGDTLRRPVVKQDFYFDEAMRITADYLQALKGGLASLALPEPASTTPPEDASAAVQAP
ncbi:MAG: carboxy terminal-processing peptidase [Pirellulales bacterium]|jgi:carboxyl-terminal processing protease|nr:carboxy terminal-processing peptidase [Pirellulales bacterium]